MLSTSSSPILKFPVNSPSPAPRRTRLRPTTIVNSATAYRQRPNLCVNNRGTPSCTSLYEVLGIPAGASSQEIKSAYRRLARTCHPDVAAMDRKDTSADEFMRIHAAYSTLSDPDQRAVYDRNLFTRRAPLTAGFSGYSGRNWETDQCW